MVIIKRTRKTIRINLCLLKVGGWSDLELAYGKSLGWRERQTDQQKDFFVCSPVDSLPFFVCILFYWDFFYIYRFRIADEFCSCLYSRKFSKKIFTKILIGDFRFLCKKRISKDKFGIKMFGNVYTEEITLQKSRLLLILLLCDFLVQTSFVYAFIQETV